MSVDRNPERPFLGVLLAPLYTPRRGRLRRGCLQAAREITLAFRSEGGRCGRDFSSCECDHVRVGVRVGGNCALGDTGAVLVMGRGRRVVEHGERTTNGGGWGHGGHGKLGREG